MAKKQFKIGECAVGGIIAVEVNNESVIVRALDYNTKRPVVADVKLPKTEPNLSNHIECYLMDITTCYFAGKIMEWIKRNFV